MVGVILKFDNWSKNIFNVLFDDIDVSMWYFNIKYWESYGQNTMINDFNKLEYIDSDLAKKELINKNSEVYPEFLELFLSNNIQINNYIKTYDEFIKSHYFMSIIIIDHRNIEICCKEEHLLNKIVNNFKNSNLKNIKIRILKKIHPDAIIRAYRSKNDKNIYD